MAGYKLRSLDTRMGTGSRTTIRLDEETWAAVDMIAGRLGIKWSEWARGLLKRNPDASNATAVIRTATINELMASSILNDEDRGLDFATMQNHPLMRNSAPLSDDQLAEILKGATVQGHSDFGGFTVLFGHDEHGQDCIWIKNALRDRQHFAFLMPEGNEK